jgi:hypothetical protein
MDVDGYRARVCAEASRPAALGRRRRGWDAEERSRFGDEWTARGEEETLSDRAAPSRRCGWDAGRP